MPTTLSSPDTLARAVIETVPPPAARLTPEQQAAKSIREKVAESSPRSTLEFLRHRQPVEQRAITEANDRNIGIGTERNPDGSKKRDAGEVGRFTDATKYSQRSKDFLEKGYDGLTDSTQKREIRNSTEQAIRAWPEADTLLSGMSVRDRDLLVESVIKNPEFAAKLRVNFEAGRAVVVPDLPADIRNRFEQAKNQEDAKKTEVSRNDSDKKSVDAQLEEFEDRTATGGRKGVKLDELQNLEKQMPQDRNQKSLLEDQLFLSQARLSSNEQKLQAYLLRGGEDVIDSLNQQVLADRQAIRKLQGQIGEIDDRENKKVTLETERNTLRQKKQQLEEERTKFNGELDGLTKARIATQAEFDSARLTRASQEQDYVDGLRNSFSESTFKYLEEKITASEEAQRTLIEEEKARTVDPGEKAILDNILKRWEKTKTVGILGKRTISVIDGQKTREDWGKCMTDMAQGPKDIMKEMLIAGGMSAPDADAKLADSAFVAKMQPQVIERLTTRRIQTGKLTEDDARRVIENPTWGKAIIDMAIKNRKDIRDALTELQGQGILRGGIAEYLRNKSGGSKLKFLLILLGIAALGAGPAAMALKNTLSEK